MLDTSRAQRPRAARPARRHLQRGLSAHVAAGQHRELRLQARPAARRRPRVRLPLPARTRTGSRSCARSTAATRRCATTCSASPDTQAFLDELRRLFELTLPAYEREGKSYLSIAVGCTGGRHRSVAIAEALGEIARRARLRARGPAPGRRTCLSVDPGGPQVVALGGGHGLAMTLRARARLRGRDHRGRERRRRRRLDRPAAPRLRRARARRPPQVPGRARRRRAGLARGVRAPVRGRRPRGPRARQPDDRRADRDPRRLLPGARRSRRLLDAVGRVLPATTDPVVLKADIEGEAVEGQVAVQNSAGRIRRVGLDPERRARLPGRPAPRSPRPTRSCWPRARSTRACSRCSASPSCGTALAQRAGAGWSRSATCGPRSPRPTGSTPPTTCGRCWSTGPGSTGSCIRRTGSLAADEAAIRGLGRRAGAGRRSPGPTGWPTIP